MNLASMPMALKKLCQRHSLMHPGITTSIHHASPASIHHASPPPFTTRHPPLFITQGLSRIFPCRPKSLYSYRSKCDQKCDDAADGDHRPVERNMIGNIIQP